MPQPALAYTPAGPFLPVSVHSVYQKINQHLLVCFVVVQLWIAHVFT